MAYSLEPDDTPPAPALPGRVLVHANADGAVGSLAAAMMAHAFEAVERTGTFHVALSGGSTPVPLYRRLMIDPAFRGFPWERTHVWLADERMVPPDDDRSNYKLLSEMLGEHAGVPPEQFHRVPTEAPDAAARYERALREALELRPEGTRRLDVCVLGMGADGHTASLFPRSPALDARNGALVVGNDGEHVTPPPRVTMTYGLINSAQLVTVLVLGESKRETIRRATSGGQSPCDLPVLGLAPESGELRWYLDADACPDDRAPGEGDREGENEGPGA